MPRPRERAGGLCLCTVLPLMYHGVVAGEAGRQAYHPQLKGRRRVEGRALRESLWVMGAHFACRLDPSGKPLATWEGGVTFSSRLTDWRVLAATVLVVGLLYVVLPYGLVTSSLYVMASFLAAALIGLALLRRTGLFDPLAWALVALAVGLAAIGHGIWYWLDLRGLAPFPAAPDAFYLAVYPLFIIALWRMGPQDGRDDGALSDALIVGVSAGVLAWALLISPYTHDAELSLVQLLVSAAYPVADLILLTMVLRLVFLHRLRVTAHLFLLLGMVAYLVADVLYAYGNAAGWYGPGGLTDGFWILAYALFVAAVWHPSASLEPGFSASPAALTGRRLIVLGVASLLVPMVILFAAGSDIEMVRVAAIASILLFLLVMQRMGGLLKKTHRQAEVLETLSMTDSLTGAANRRRFQEELSREIDRSQRTHSPLSLAFLDLDHFKRFNDEYGHQAGDWLLQALVAGWRTKLRASDLLARVGGEEFLVILPDADAERAGQVVERLRQDVPRGETVSGGLVVHQAGESPDQLIARADRALYAAKHQGRNRVVLA